MKKTSILTAVLLALAFSLTARDFDVVSPSGHTLYCDVVQGGAAIVGMDYSPQNAEPIHLVIPSHVSNGSTNLNVVAIGDSAFIYCFWLFDVQIPSSVKSIGRDAFNRCFGLGSFAVPATVENIADDAFAFVLNVEYSGPAQGAPWGAYYLNAYHEGQYYYSDNQKTHIVCCQRDATDATIPSSVTSIGANAFSYCTNITSLTIDSTIDNVESEAFQNCTGLESVYYDAKSSEGYTFSGCTSLRQLTLGETMAVIPYGFCSGCSSLQSIVIPDNIVSVGTDAFIDCTSLESATIGNGLCEVGISTGMFEGCTSLKYISMPDNLQNIRSFSFKNCTSLSQIILPTSIIGIGSFAFAGCSSVGSIVSMGSTVPSVGSHAFDSIDSAIEVVVPCGKESQYRQAEQWQRFENIQGQKYYVVTTANNPSWGQATCTQQPTCDDNTATIEAQPEEGCRFVRWDDNNTDNPRQIAHNGTGLVHRKAIFEQTAGVGETEMAQTVKVYTSNGNIVVEGAAGEPVWIFDIMGRLLYESEIRNAVFVIRRPTSASGICLVKVGNRKAEKITLL